MIDGCINGGFNIRNIDHDEYSILNDFSSNVNIIKDGVQISQDQITNELYYNNSNYNQNVVNSNVPKKIVEMPEEPKPIEPGQVDPSSFFSNNGFYDLFK